MIMANNIDVNTCSVYGVPVLVHACDTAHENEQICLMMLQKGADPTKREKAGPLSIILLRICDKFERLKILQSLHSGKVCQVAIEILFIFNMQIVEFCSF